MSHRLASLLIIVALASTLILSVFASNKLQEVPLPVGINGPSSIISKCLAPLSSIIFGKPELQPVCSAEEFSGYSAEELMQLNGKEIKSLPPSYFESLKIDQAIPLSPTFINNLKKEQAMAFSKSAEKVLPEKSRKLLKKIKRKPGPIARAVIMILSALTAFLIFKYS